MANKWLCRLEDADGNVVAIQEMRPRDARGLRLMRECGYTWINAGHGWRQIQFLIAEAECREAVSA